MKIKILGLAAIALLLPFAAACSDDSTGDLDKGDLSEEIQKSGVDKEQADCMADALIKADFTKEELDAANSGDDTKLDSKKQAKFTSALTDCIDVSDLTVPGS